MKNLFIILILLVPIISKSQSEIKCDINKISEVKKNLGNLNEEIVKDFLLTFDKTCKNNIEYSEFSRETLYELLNQNPLILIETMDK